jgi:hypothetical protein
VGGRSPALSSFRWRPVRAGEAQDWGRPSSPEAVPAAVVPAAVVPAAEEVEAVAPAASA